MERIEYRDVVDKSEWGPGEWQDEPDKIQWQDADTGLPCLIVRGPSGSLCGYVGVAPGHPMHGKHYDAVDVEVHGGLTFARGCADMTREKWEIWRKKLLARRLEAERYPEGDASRYLREWTACLDDFDAWQARAKASFICHVAAPGEADPVWWLGFDTAHLGDVSPAARFRAAWDDPDDRYRTVAYVERECRELAAQLKAMV
jgi:hypothetical protein